MIQSWKEPAMSLDSKEINNGNFFPEKQNVPVLETFILLVIAGGAMYAPYGPFFAIITEVLPKNVSGGAIALINSFGALGSFLGSYFVGYLNGTTGSFDASYIFMSGSLFLSALLTMWAVKDSVISTKKIAGKEKSALLKAVE